MVTGSLLWHRRFEARVVASVIVLVALSLAAILLATTRVVTTRSLARASADLQAAREAFHRLVDERAEFARAQSELVTALPVFRAHLNDVRLIRDVDTMRAMADHYRQQLKASFAIIGDQSGAWIAASGWPGPEAPSKALTGAIAQAGHGNAAQKLIAAADRLFLVVAAPAGFADEVLGTLTVGYALDDDLVKSLAELTHCDINLVAEGRVYASSLPAADRAALTAAVAQPGWIGAIDSTRVQRVGEGDYILGGFPLSLRGSDEAAGQLVLLENWNSTQAFLAQLRWRLLATGAGIFAIAIGMAVFFSRRMARPLEDLADAARDIADGNWTRQLPVRGTAEEVVMAQSVNSMTTSLRHWYEEAKARDDQLKQAQKLEALGRLAGGVAHDFNNFLTAIKGYAELLLDDDADDSRRPKIEGIVKAADTAAGLTKQLLAFSRRRVVAVRAISLERVLLGTERMLRRLIGEDIELRTAIAPGTGCVRADPTQIEQVLVNLLVNARDAMPGGGKITIELSTAVLDEAFTIPHAHLRAGRYVRLSVRDTGCGMTPDVKARIFEPFFTTKQEGAGTGLGLSMVYGIVEQLGGGILVETEVDRGTTFEVYLPHTMEADADAVAVPAPATLRGTETVLLVEDEPQLAALIARVLKSGGYTVLQAGDAAEALDLVRTHPHVIHLLLTDVVMPGMNGRELAERVSAERRDIRVLFMSGYSEDQVLRHGVEAATAQFIPKPFSMQTLTAKIREVLSLPLQVPA